MAVSYEDVHGRLPPQNAGEQLREATEDALAALRLMLAPTNAPCVRLVAAKVILEAMTRYRALFLTRT